MGIFNWRKEKKKTNQPTLEEFQTEEERLDTRANQILRDGLADLKRTEERNEAAVKSAAALGRALRELDESGGHRKSMDVASESAKKIMRDLERRRECAFVASCNRFEAFEKRIYTGKDVQEEISQGKEENVQEGEIVSIDEQVRIYNELHARGLIKDISELRVLYLHEKMLRYGERESFRR